MTKQFVLQSFFVCITGTNINIMANKMFNLFYECAATCLHLFLQEKLCTTSS